MGCPLPTERLFLCCDGTPFADHGDSGSVVHSSNGQVTLLLSTGLSSQQAGNQRHAYVTPIEDGFADIKVEGEGLSRLLIAELELCCLEKLM